MDATNRNAQFLSAIKSEEKALIIGSIALHYGITVEEAEAEVIDAEAEHLLDYMREPQRSATSALMQQHNLRGW